MVPLPSAEPSEINTFKTIARLTMPQTQNDHYNNTHVQPTYSNSTLTNNNINSSHQSNDVHHYDQSIILLQQFSLITGIEKFHRPSVW